MLAGLIADSLTRLRLIYFPLTWTIFSLVYITVIPKILAYILKHNWALVKVPKHAMLTCVYCSELPAASSPPQHGWSLSHCSHCLYCHCCLLDEFFFFAWLVTIKEKMFNTIQPFISIFHIGWSVTTCWLVQRQKAKRRSSKFKTVADNLLPWLLSWWIKSLSFWTN